MLLQHLMLFDILHYFPHVWLCFFFAIAWLHQTQCLKLWARREKVWEDSFVLTQISGSGTVNGCVCHYVSVCECVRKHAVFTWSTVPYQQKNQPPNLELTNEKNVFAASPTIQIPHRSYGSSPLFLSSRTLPPRGLNVPFALYFPRYCL